VARPRGSSTSLGIGGIASDHNHSLMLMRVGFLTAHVTLMVLTAYKWNVNPHSSRNRRCPAARMILGFVGIPVAIATWIITHYTWWSFRISCNTSKKGITNNTPRYSESTVSKPALYIT
jgi:hypothetical protein